VFQAAASVAAAFFVPAVRLEMGLEIGLGQAELIR
jgi:hypothetical protein